MVVGRDEVAEVALWDEGIAQVYRCTADRFRWQEPRQRALEYLKGFLISVRRKNGWRLAEHPCGWAKEATPLSTGSSASCLVTTGVRTWSGMI